MSKYRVAWLGALALILFLPTEASAHLVSTRFGDFYDGMLHPITALEHIVPWLALGLLVGLQPGVGRWALLLFPLGLLAGIALAMAQPGLSGPSVANLASLTVLGALVALALPWPGWLMGAIACAVGVSHGYANGAAMMPEINPALYMPGVMTAGYLVILFVAAVAATATRRWPAARIAARALGSWIFAIGVMMLGASLAA